MSSSRKKTGKSRAAGKPIVLPSAYAPRTAAADQMILNSDQAAQIQQLADLLKRNHLTELEIERSGMRIRIRHEPPVRATTTHTVEAVHTQSSTPGAAPTAQTRPSAETDGQVTITSPIVGTFYRSPSPDADPYVEEGDYVKKGQVLCIVEAMKLMNEIESEADGRITKILAESTKPVEYGQPLFLIDPSATP
ncbi:MAG: Biotin carboxyl carrier protein of acetyl-CoA carboxylase [Nitrospira sp.]|nr:MAG: Biotin carboxyl carrier protein of acetyl-CoA carboxylase [Nitrospira sp.]